MLKGLLLVERLVFDSLSRREKNIMDIVTDTGLNYSTVRSLLSNLVLKNIIVFERGVYKRNITTLNPQDHRDEVVEVAQSMEHVILKKMVISEEDAKILESMMASINSFLNNIQNKQLSRPIGHKTCEKKVVLMGISNYSVLADASLKAV